MNKFKLLVIALIATTQVNVMCQETHAAEKVAGNWASDVRMSSSLSSNPALNYYWVGKMWGRLEPSGKMTFVADNGCEISGLVHDAHGYEISGDVDVSKCGFKDMNRRYSASVKFKSGKPNISISLRYLKNGGGNGKIDTWNIDGTFLRY
jgi:hypothetical protein